MDMVCINMYLHTILTARCRRTSPLIALPSAFHSAVLLALVMAGAFTAHEDRARHFSRRP